MTAFLKKILLLLMPFSALVFIACLCARPVAASAPDKITVVIDAGHGGVDGGVTGANSGVKEADLNLEVAKGLKTLFESAGVNVVLTRTTSAGLYGAFSSGFKRRDLESRVKIAKASGADVFISVHMNKYSDSTRRGAQVFYKIGHEESKALADSIQKSLNVMEGAVRECTVLAGDYYVLNYSDCPAVICECGFLSSPEDEKLLLDENYRKTLCHSIFSGTIDYLAGNESLTALYNNSGSRRLPDVKL